jgi:hypothetical protein
LSEPGNVYGGKEKTNPVAVEKLENYGQNKYWMCFVLKAKHVYPLVRVGI